MRPPCAMHSSPHAPIERHVAQGATNSGLVSASRWVVPDTSLSITCARIVRLAPSATVRSCVSSSAAIRRASIEPCSVARYRAFPTASRAHTGSQSPAGRWIVSPGIASPQVRYTCAPCGATERKKCPARSAEAERRAWRRWARRVMQTSPHDAWTHACRQHGKPWFIHRRIDYHHFVVVMLVPASPRTRVGRRAGLGPQEHRCRYHGASPFTSVAIPLEIVAPDANRKTPGRRHENNREVSLLDVGTCRYRDDSMLVRIHSTSLAVNRATRRERVKLWGDGQTHANPLAVVGPYDGASGTRESNMIATCSGL